MKLLKITTFSLVLIGIILIISGFCGIGYISYKVAKENITTPSDAFIPNTKVRGPFTLIAQAEIIRHHVLKITGGKTYSEMPSKIPVINSDGTSVLDADGKPTMIDNSARDIWITANTLITALNLGVISYAFSGLVFVLGVGFLLIGVTFRNIIKIKHENDMSNIDKL